MVIESILAEVEADTKEEAEIEVGTTIMEVDIEVDMMEHMDVVGTADEVAVDTADMEIIVVGHIAGITEGAMVIIIEIIVTSRTEQYYCQKYFLQIMNS